MLSLKWLEGVMLEDDEPGPVEVPVGDWLSLTLPTQDSPPQAPAAEFPQAPAAEFPQAPAAEFPQAPAAEFPQTPAAEFPQTPAAETPQTPAVEIPQTPVAEFSQTPVVDISSSPSTSPGSISVGWRKRPRVVEIPRPPVFDLSSSPSPSPRPIPVGGISQPPVVELSSSPSISEGSVPVVGASSSAFAETSSSRSASQGAVPVAGRKKAKRKRASKEVPFVEVTVVSPPSHDADADEFSQMQARTEWTKQAVNVLPNHILVAAPRRGKAATQQIYTPCSSWQEFIDRTREAELKREDSRVERTRQRQFKRHVEEGPADPIGSSRAAIEEIYRPRLDPEEFRRLSLFDN